MKSVLGVQTLWWKDVVKAWLATCNHADVDKPEKLLAFLEAIQNEHEMRWQRDPKGGEGAVNWLRNLMSDKGDL